MRYLLLCVYMLLGGSALATAPLTDLSVDTKPQSEYAHVRVAFTPGDNIAALIIDEIREAKSDVRVHAYLFTSKAIANALIGALRRGVKVEAIADAGEYEKGNSPVLPRLVQHGAIVYLNDRQKSSHNKIVLIDASQARATVITGSYNFTRAAQSQNAENVVILSGNRDIAQRYLRNWEFHKSRSMRMK